MTFAPAWLSPQIVSGGWQVCRCEASLTRTCRPGSVARFPICFRTRYMFTMLDCVKLRDATIRGYAARISDSLRRQERMPARALALSHTEQHVRRNHGRVGKLGELRDARVRRALVPVASRIHLPSCGRLAMISWIAQETNGDAELDPHGQPARHKALGAVLRRKSSTRQRIFDSDVFAHGYRRANGRVAGMPARELRICGMR